MSAELSTADPVGGSAPKPDDPRVIRAIEEYLAEAEAGRAPERAAFLARHAAIAPALADCLAGLDFVRGGLSREETPPAGQPDARRDGEVVAPGTPLGDFRILREVGRGGMGVVYEAEQLSLGRRVALKVLPFAAALDAKQLQRFKHEAQAAAHLHHPHIVPVYFVGCERGVHFYAMQFIDGQTLAALIDELRQTASAPHRPAEEGTTGPWPPAPREESGQPPARPPAAPAEADTQAGAVLPTEYATVGPAFFRAAAQLGVQAAGALEHAHQLGVVHRDVKPANLLVDTGGQLWVTDFGLAQIRSEAQLTMTGHLVGTLRYMSPEQALAKRGLVDHRTDVYALGATLYELVTRQPAFNGGDREELLRQIEREEPRPPRQIDAAVPVELETILLKALAKDHAERYATAQELADDLRRFLEDKPIRAKRPTPWQRLKKWARRHRGAVLAAGMCGALVLLLAVGGLAAGAVLLSREEERTRAANRLLQLLLYYQTIASAEREHSTGNVGRAEQLLGQCDAALRGWEWHYLRRQRYGNPPPLRHGGHLWSLAPRPDGGLLAVGESDGRITLWDPRTGAKVRSLDAAHSDQVRGLAFSPDGRWLASTSWDGWMKVWEVAADAEAHPLFLHPEGTLAVAFSPDGRRLAWGGLDGTARVRDLQTGEEVSLRGHAKAVRRLVFSPDGERLISGSDDGTVRIWDAPTGEREELTPRLTLPAHDHRVFDVAVSRDGRRLASAGGQFVMHGDEGEVKIWDAATGAKLHTLRGHTGAVYAVAFSPDGRRLASGGEDPTVKVWDVAHGTEALTLRGHREAVWGLAFSPDGHRLYSASGDHTVRIWDATPLEQRAGPERHTLAGHQGRVTCVVFTADGTRLVSAGMDRTVRVWDVSRGVLTQALPVQGGPVHCLALSRDGGRLATGNWSTGLLETGTGAVRVWDTQTWKERPGPAQLYQPGVRGLAFSADGRFLAGAGDGVVMVWDADAGALFATHPGECHFVSAAFSRRGCLAAADENGTITVRDDPLAGRPSQTFGTYAGRAFCVAFSPDGRRLTAAGVDGAIHVWDADTWRPAAAPGGHPSGARAVTYSPDNRRLATGGDDAAVRVWDADTGRELLVLRGHTDTVCGVAFSPDGRLLASASKDGTVKIWDVDTEVRGRAATAPPDVR